MCHLTVGGVRVDLDASAALLGLTDEDLLMVMVRPPDPQQEDGRERIQQLERLMQEDMDVDIG